MKNNILYCSLALFAGLAMASCSKDTEIINVNEFQKRVIDEAPVAHQIGLSFSENESGSPLMEGLNSFGKWDKIELWNLAVDKKYSFTKEGSSETFGGDANIHKGDMLYAVYPAKEAPSDTLLTEFLSFEMPSKVVQEGKEINLEEHYCAMGQGLAGDNGTLKVKMQPVPAVLKWNLKNISEDEDLMLVDSVEIASKMNSFAAKVNFDNRLELAKIAKKTDRLVIALNGQELKYNEALEAAMLVLPTSNGADVNGIEGGSDLTAKVYTRIKGKKHLFTLYEGKAEQFGAGNFQNSNGQFLSGVEYTVDAALDNVAKPKNHQLRAEYPALTGATSAWTVGEEISLWNVTRMKGYQFSSSNANAIGVFNGKAVMLDKDQFLAVYPKVNALSADGFTKVKKSNVTVHEGKALNQVAPLMTAVAKFNENAEIFQLKFNRQTALVQWTIANSGRNMDSFKMDSVVIRTADNCFPVEATINTADGKLGNFAKHMKSLCVKLSGESLKPGEKIEVMSELLPTQLLKGNSNIEILAFAHTSEGEEKVLSIYKGVLSGTQVIKGLTDDNFEAGKLYTVDYIIANNLKPENELSDKVIDGVRVVKVLSSKGLKSLNERVDEYSAATIQFDKKVTYDMEGMEWKPFNNFTGKIEGNGAVIKNLTFKGDETGLVKLNKGTIQNLTIEDAKVDAKIAGVFAAKNVAQAKLEGCIAKNITMQNVNMAGGVVGHNEAEVNNCKVIGGNFVGNPGADNKQAIGGLAGENTGIIRSSEVTGKLTISSNGGQHLGGFLGSNKWKFSGKIEGCGVGSEVSIVSTPKGGNSGLGGFVGGAAHNAQGYIVGCYSLASVVVKQSSHLGGFAGSIGGLPGAIIGCYAGGKIEATVESINVGGFVGNQFNNAAVEACYSTTEIKTVPNSPTGGFNGKNSKGASKIKNCFYTNEPAVAQGKGEKIGAEKVSVAELKAKIDVLNKIIKAKGYRFVLGTTDKEPLKIEKIK